MLSRNCICILIIKYILFSINKYVYYKLYWLFECGTWLSEMGQTLGLILVEYEQCCTDAGEMSQKQMRCDDISWQQKNIKHI